MESVQAWAAGVCFTVTAAALLQYLSPNGAMERVMKLVLGAFVLCGVLLPILTLLPQLANGFDVSVDNTQVTSIDLTDTVDSQIYTAAQAGVQNVVTTALVQAGITCKNVALVMDKNDDGSISISKVLVTVSGVSASQAVIEQQLSSILGLQTEVIIDAG